MYLHSIQLAIPKTRFSFISFGFNSVAKVSEAANNIKNRPSETVRETKGRKRGRWLEEEKKNLQCRQVQNSIT